MSFDNAAGPPPEPPSQPPSQPPGQPPRGPSTRVPWIVAIAAAVVAVAAVVALVVVQRGSGTSERGFDSPEDAVAHVVEHLADDDADGAMEAFAVESMVEGFDFEAQAERLQSVSSQSWLPASSDGYDQINERVRRGEVAAQLRSLVRSILAPDRDLTNVIALDDEVSAADLVDEVSPDDLAELSVAQTEVIERADSSYAENLKVQGDIYGADEVKEVAVLLDSAEGELAAGVTVVRYDDDWYVLQLSAPILGTPPYAAQRATEEEFEDVVASARGED